MTDGIATYVGVDWASVTHYAFALDPEGGKLGYKGFVHSGDGLAELVEWIRRTAAVEPGRVAIGIEVPHGPVVETQAGGSSGAAALLWVARTKRGSSPSVTPSSLRPCQRRTSFP